MFYPRPTLYVGMDGSQTGFDFLSLPGSQFVRQENENEVFQLPEWPG